MTSESELDGKLQWRQTELKLKIYIFKILLMVTGP